MHNFAELLIELDNRMDNVVKIGRPVGLVVAHVRDCPL
jgi:hypothetical protein